MGSEKEIALPRSPDDMRTGMEFPSILWDNELMELFIFDMGGLFQ